MSRTEGQHRVVVIQDAIKEFSANPLRWVLNDLKLQAGDVLVLLGVLHQVINPMGYKVKMDSSTMFGVNPKLIADEVAKKTEEYRSNEELLKISKKCEQNQIEFRVEVQAGSVSKEVVLQAAKSLRATWVILDSQMKKDKKLFMDKLPCGISRMKRDNTVELLRGPKPSRKTTPEKSIEINHAQGIRYDEMIPAWPKDGRKDGSTKSAESETSAKTNPENDRLAEHFERVMLEKGHEKHNWSGASSSSSSNQLMTLSDSSLGYYEMSNPAVPEAKRYFLRLGEQSSTTSSATESEDRKPNAACTNETAANEKEKQHTSDDDWMGGSSSDELFRNYICSHCKNRRPKIGWKRDFTYSELHDATKGFSENNFLSEGGFGSVYKGEINGLMIAVKQQKSASMQGEKEFKSEVLVLSKARHENVVMLLGSCSDGSDRLLVYEYVCNGSLDQHLSKHTRKPLSWEKRMKIARGAANGLQYLHENNIIHRDMRPNNILITHDQEALLGDFGLARTQREDCELSSETRVVGTLGYLAPEYAEYGKVSKKTDVYAFGVVLLQLITGLKTTDKVLGGKSLVGWARPLLKEKNYPDLIDQRIVDSHDVHQLFWMVRVAEKCLCKDPEKRLSMDTVVYALNQIMEKSRCGIENFSPAQSDTVSTPDSFETQEDDDDVFSLESASLRGLSQERFFRPAASSSSSSFSSSPPVKLLPSLSPPPHSRRLSGALVGYDRTAGSSSDGTSDREGTPRRSILYSEMVL